jgi:Rap1a immunity proteins
MRLRAATLGASAILALWPVVAGAVTQDNFLVRTTDDLVQLCSPGAAEDLRIQAIHFCEGFVVGANQYYLAERAGSHAPRLFCVPTPSPSRDEVVRMFVDWARANPQYLSERAADSLVRFGAATWPCGK